MTVRPFISYAREDAQVAVWLHAELSAAGTEPWLDTVNLIAGEEWQLAIDRALGEASHVIALISRQSVDKRGWVQRELRKALDLLEEWPPGTIFVIPVRLDDSAPRHAMLRRLQWIDLFEDSEAGVRRLLTAMGVKKRAGRSSLPALHRSIGGYPDVPPETLRRIVNNSKRFGPDLIGRGDFVQKELDAWRYVMNFHDATIPLTVLQEIVRNLAETYPDSVFERKFMLPREVICWKLLQSKVADLARIARFAPLVERALQAWPKSFAGQYFSLVGEMRNHEDGY